MSFDFAFATRTKTGGAALVIHGGQNGDSFSGMWHNVAHEYVHVLQGQLASRYATNDAGERLWATVDQQGINLPSWLIEGLASYGDFIYTPTREGRRGFLDDRYTPHSDLGWHAEHVGISYDDLERTAQPATSQCGFDGWDSSFYAYALSFLAADYLAEISTKGNFIQFLWAMGDAPTWQVAFADTFGIQIGNFYSDFEAWLPSQIPQYDSMEIAVSWPDIADNPLAWPELIDLWPRNWQFPNGRPDGWRVSTGRSDAWGNPVRLTVTYAEGGVWSAKLMLSWTDDQITSHLLGWYRDGQLTPDPNQASRVQFSPTATDKTWQLPAHPNTLNRLASCDLPCSFEGVGQAPIEQLHHKRHRQGERVNMTDTVKGVAR